MKPEKWEKEFKELWSKMVGEFTLLSYRDEFIEFIRQLLEKQKEKIISEIKKVGVGMS